MQSECSPVIGYIHWVDHAGWQLCGMGSAAVLTPLLVQELIDFAPERCWRLVLVDATLADVDTHRAHLLRKPDARRKLYLVCTLYCWAGPPASSWGTLCLTLTTCTLQAGIWARHLHAVV